MELINRKATNSWKYAPHKMNPQRYYIISVGLCLHSIQQYVNV